MCMIKWRNIYHKYKFISWISLGNDNKLGRMQSFVKKVLETQSQLKVQRIQQVATVDLHPPHHLTREERNIIVSYFKPGEYTVMVNHNYKKILKSDFTCPDFSTNRTVCVIP